MIIGGSFRNKVIMLEQKQSVCDRQKAWVVVIVLPGAIVDKQEKQQSRFIHRGFCLGKSCKRVSWAPWNETNILRSLPVWVFRKVKASVCSSDTCGQGGWYSSGMHVESSEKPWYSKAPPGEGTLHSYCNYVPWVKQTWQYILFTTRRSP